MNNGLLENLYNPDVLSCLANLSNDEVFTTPDVVNAMLDMLPQDIFKNPDTTFLDPSCKTGVFLREIAKRLIVGLENQIPDLDERIEHIFKKQLYGLAITELTSLVSRRSVYCSKWPNGEYSIAHFETPEGNIRFKKTNHSWVGDKCFYCGASKVQYNRSEDLESHAYEFIHIKKVEDIFNMKFDVIIGNPPYQLSDGGNGSSAKPIYQLFIKQAIKLQPRYLSMIIPSRWFAGGKGLDDFRTDMLNDRRFSKIVDYPNAKDCFPSNNISGGVMYFLWDKQYNGDCEFTNVIGKEKITQMRKLNEYELFIRYNDAISIIHKIVNSKQKMLSEIITSRKPFGLDSFERGHEKYSDGDLTLFSSKGQSYIENEKVSIGLNLVDKYKVIIGKALSGHIGETDENGQVKVLAKVALLKPYEVCTESYLCVGSFDNIEEAQNLEQYLHTKFARFLLLQALTSMNITKDKFCFVPQVDFTKSYTDEELYNMFNFSKEEKNFIEAMIKPWDEDGE